jgi:hypothetical protein
VVVAAIVIQHNNQAAAHKRAVAAASRRAAAHRHAILVAQQRARQAARKVAQAEAKLNRDLATIQRNSIVSALQGAVKKDALKDVSDGLLNGPILKADCQPASATDQTASTIANYSCLAVSSTAADGTESGYRFTATINIKTGSYTWKLGG